MESSLLRGPQPLQRHRSRPAAAVCQERAALVAATGDSARRSPAAGRSRSQKGLGGMTTAKGEMDTVRAAAPRKILHSHPGRLAANPLPRAPLIVPVALHLLQLRLPIVSINLDLPTLSLEPLSPTSPIGNGDMEFVSEKRATQISLCNSAF